MRVAASPYIPRVRPVIRAGGGTVTPTPPTPAPTTAPAPAPSPAPTTGGFDIKALGLKVQSFFQNLWDTMIGPFFKSIFGMFGA